MPYTQDQLDGFLRNPREALDTELKAWFDPSAPEGTIHDFKHSDYFAEEFVRKFWKPWIHDEICEQSDYDASRAATSTWRSYLAMLPIQWLLLALVGWLALCWWLGWSWWPF